LQIYNIPNTVAAKPAPTLGFKLKRGKLIQSSEFIGWKSSRHERASSLQQSCPLGLTLSYLLLNARLFLVNSSVSTIFLIYCISVPRGAFCTFLINYVSSLARNRFALRQSYRNSKTPARRSCVSIPKTSRETQNESRDVGDVSSPPAFLRAFDAHVSLFKRRRTPRHWRVHFILSFTRKKEAEIEIMEMGRSSYGSILYALREREGGESWMETWIDLLHHCGTTT